MRTWKPIRNTNKLYWVSDDGLIESRQYNKKRILKPRIVKKRKESRGHLRVKITVNGKRVRKLVHRLVAKAFIPNPDNLPQINHKDGDGHNNHKDNLEWGTQSHNMLHSYRVLGQPHNLKPQKGETNPSSKLTWADVDNIRESYRLKQKNQKELSKQYGVTRTQINLIINNKRWKK